MRQLNIANLVAYIIAIFFAGFGLAIITGIIPLSIEPKMSRLFGALLILMAVYRFAFTRMKTSSLQQRKKIFDEDE